MATIYMSPDPYHNSFTEVLNLRKFDPTKHRTAGLCFIEKDSRVLLLEEKPAHHPLEPLDVALKHTGWMPPAYLYSLAESAKVEGKRIVNSDIN